jgi:hypothetical protein
MSELRATPQNAALGYLANLLKQTYSPQRTQQMQGVMEFLGVPAVARTVERMSYGQPITNINKANVPLLPEDTAEAAMIVAPPLASMAKRVGTNLVQTAPYVARDIAQSMSSPLKSYVVKPKGGNWLSGSVESAIKPLKSYGVINSRQYPYGPEFDAAAQARIASLRETAAQPGYVGGAGTVAQHLENDMANPRVREAAINRWLDTKLSKYMRNEMGTPEDPIRALAERDILHVDPERGLDYVAQDVVRNRMSADSMVRTPTLDSPGTRMGVMPPAREWEDATDSLIAPRSAGDLTAGANKSPYWETSLTAEHRLEQDPWLAKVPPETPVYQFSDQGDVRNRLGFGHLIDELKFSMDPNSGLPDNLRFDPKDVDKITVPQAVERVSKINAWRAEQAAQAEKAGMMENLKATPRLPDEGLQLSFVDKPGGAWVDIPETTEVKGKQLCTSIGKAGGWCTQNNWAAESYGSGDNRLTALVDAEGRPHAQAKITSQPLRTWDDVTAAVGPEQAGVWWKELDRTNWYNSPDPNKAFDDFIKSKNIPVTADVTELKPPGNSFNSDRAQEYMKRDPDYKTKVTDSVLKFLNGGEWGKVTDLDHYDIVDLQNPATIQTALKDVLPYHLSMERAGIFNQAIDATPNTPRFMTQQQLRDFIGPVEPPDTDVPGYAGGGLVKGAVKNIGEMVQKYLAKETPEAVVTAAKAAPTEQKMLQGFYRGYAGENAPAKTAFGAETYFVSPQRKVADYYAQRRAAETGAEPHAEMILADPFFTRNNPYGLSIPIDKHNRDFLVTRARRVDPDEVKSRTPLYAEGGSVSAYDPMQVDDVMNSINAPRGYAEGGSVTAYDSGRVDAILNQFM